MKNISCIIFLSSLAIACHKDIQKTQSTPILPEPLVLSDKIRGMIPKEYQNSKYAVFKNSTGQYKYLSIKYSENEITKRFENEKYVSESMRVVLSDSTDSDYYIKIEASGTYSGKTKSFQSVFMSLTTAKNNGLIPIIVIDEDGSALWGDSHASRKLLDKVFLKVYQNYDIQTISFSEFFYTVQEGVVGFRDINNDLWVLEKFE